MTRAQIEQKYHVKIPYGISREKLDVIVAGAELNYLTKEDVEYIVTPKCNTIKAVNILVDRRKNAPS